MLDNITTSKELNKRLSEEEFDNLMSTEYRLTKTITPDLIAYDPKIFESTAVRPEDGVVLGSRPSEYSIPERIRACIIHTCTGSVAKTEAITQIGYATLLNWKNKSNWWPIIRLEVEKLRNDILEAKLTEVIDAATDEMLDRIKNGNEVYNHATGEKVRVKANLSELATAGLKVAQEKRNEMRGMESMGTGKKDILEHLSKLAGVFEEIAGKLTNKREGDIVDGEVISTNIST